ncbi:MAG: tRNA dihydrouridine synthase DusB [Candidatus Latescibacteria bacterium]|nr:tRNA dihydrouridine synthase DusB [bacterium]MBD3423885.1 tRNA dihydrouridine synthase DusB [Candidatus Latescibacterota bacterium]
MFDKPAVMLAPLAGYTDPPFRLLCFEFGADLAETEMISSEGLIRGCERTAAMMDIFEGEGRVGIQLFGSRPPSMASAAEIAAKKRPAFIDINFGCPVKKVVRKNGGAGLMRDLDLMGRIARAVTSAVELPVTAKIRSGWTRESENYIEAGRILQDCGVSAVTLHPRYRSQFFRGEANWNHITSLNAELEIPVIANGDIAGPAELREIINKTGCLTVMVGRAAIGRPWLFNKLRREIRRIYGSIVENGDYEKEAEYPDSLSDKLKIFEKFVRMEVDYKGEQRAILEMRKHYRWYIRGYRGMKEYRARLSRCETLEEVLSILSQVREEIEGN